MWVDTRFPIWTPSSLLPVPTYSSLVFDVIGTLHSFLGRIYSGALLNSVLAAPLECFFLLFFFSLVARVAFVVVESAHSELVEDTSA